MNVIEHFISQAQNNKRRIVLPETNDERIILATIEIVKQDIANLILVGNKNEIISKIADPAIIDKITIYDATIDTALATELAQILYERRKAKGMTAEMAKDTVLNKKHFFGALLVEKGLADGMVCGADCTTGETIRAVIQCVGTKQGSSIISSFFIMKVQNPDLGKDGVLFFADCAVNPSPDAQQLASIAMDTATNYKKLMLDEPLVGMLSFSTYGSAEHPLVNKVREALQLVKQTQPELKIDGELQLDAAVVPNIANKKAPGSTIAGKANCLIFPDLQSGNIGYKLVERMGNALAIGPILQGCKKPINDLSRGCSVEDVVYVTAITSAQVETC